MRVLVCGGRNYHKQNRVFEVLDEVQANTPNGISLIIEGGADGADRQGRYWAKSRGIPCVTMDAQWDYYGRNAGHVRNEWMVKFGKPDLVLAFPGGAGTDDMKKTALASGVVVEGVE